MLYFLVGSRELDGGAMVTASHNPKAYTGVKLVREGALALSGDAGIGEIRGLDRAGAARRRRAAARSRRSTSTRSSTDTRSSFIEPESIKPLQLVVDGGNGMAGPMVGPLLERLGLEPSTTYWVPDGEFPDHEPNPLLEENRRFIVDRVLAERADLGIAWDGDADRCFFIDERECSSTATSSPRCWPITCSQSEPGATIVYDVRASRAVPDTIADLGGRPQINRVGHAFFKQALRSYDATFGGEVSGHYYFRDFWCADSGTIPALLVLELLSVEGARSPSSSAPFVIATSSPARSTPRSPTRRRR